MEEKQSLLEKGVLVKIESRLNKLENSVDEILKRSDEINEVTQEKLEQIQTQLEQQSTHMRKLRRKLMHRYHPALIVGIFLIIIVLWLLFVHWAAG